MHTHQCVSQVYEQSRLDVLQDQFEFLFHFVCGQLPLLFAPLLPISVAWCLTSSHVIALVPMYCSYNHIECKRTIPFDFIACNPIQRHLADRT
jgi:hypothetical protein